MNYEGFVIKAHKQINNNVVKSSIEQLISKYSIFSKRRILNILNKNY